MITFKQFLNEMPERLHLDRKFFSPLDQPKLSVLSKNTIGKVGKYNLARIKNNYYIRYVLYEGNKTLMSTAGYEDIIDGRTVFTVAVTKANQGLEITAVDLYSYMISKLNMVLISDNSQTKGGESIWKRLSQLSNINVGRTTSSGFDIDRGPNNSLFSDHVKIKPNLLSRWREHYRRRNWDMRFIAWKGEL